MGLCNITRAGVSILAYSTYPESGTEPYRDAHPRPDEALLIVEVSHSTVEYDRDVKTPLYAEAGIPELWLVNLDEDYIEGLSDPVGAGYRAVRRYARGERIAPSLLPDAALGVSEILG